jgi:hypothetical protein
MGLGIVSIFKYLGLAIEAAGEAKDVMAKIDAMKEESSDGGTEITHAEKLQLASQLDENFGKVVTRICQEVGLEIKQVTVTVEI